MTVTVDEADEGSMDPIHVHSEQGVPDAPARELCPGSNPKLVTRQLSKLACGFPVSASYESHCLALY